MLAEAAPRDRVAQKDETRQLTMMGGGVDCEMCKAVVGAGLQRVVLSCCEAFSVSGLALKTRLSILAPDI